LADDEMFATISEVSKLSRIGGAFATLAIWLIVGWTGTRDGFRHYQPVARATFFDAAALVATLPRVLIPPAVPSGRQLVAIVARDVDADGDLDVVANDGSLHLSVWINDGTGRLTRREGRHSTGIQPEPGGPGLASGPVGPGAVLHSLFSFVHPRSSISSVLSVRSRPRSDGSPDALRGAFIAHRTPRAPPSFDSLT